MTNVRPALVTLHVGFTGTQYGMTAYQHDRVTWLFEDLHAKNSDVVLHHGLCIGSDEQAHWLGRKFGFRITGHPPENPAKRAWLECDELWPEKPYLTRNHDIVDASSLMVATPREMEEVLRSGTWATVRYARAQGKLWTIVRPKPTE